MSGDQPWPADLPTGPPEPTSAVQPEEDILEESASAVVSEEVLASPVITGEDEVLVEVEDSPIEVLSAPEPSSSSGIRRDRSRSPSRRSLIVSKARPPQPPQPLRPTYAAVPDEIRFFCFRSTSGLWEQQSRIERYGRPKGQHLCLDFHQVLDRSRWGLIKQGNSLPLENLQLLERIVAEHPGDSILLCSHLEDPSLLRGLLDALGNSRGANHLLPVVAITPRKVGPLGKPCLLATLSNSRDWLLVDDNAETIDHHVRSGGSGIDIALPRRPWCRESVEWQHCLADCFDSIVASKRSNDVL